MTPSVCCAVQAWLPCKHTRRSSTEVSRQSRPQLPTPPFATSLSIRDAGNLVKRSEKGRCWQRTGLGRGGRAVPVNPSADLCCEAATPNPLPLLLRFVSSVCTRALGSCCRVCAAVRLPQACVPVAVLLLLVCAVLMLSCVRGVVLQALECSAVALLFTHSGSRGHAWALSVPSSFSAWTVCYPISCDAAAWQDFVVATRPA